MIRCSWVGTRDTKAGVSVWSEAAALPMSRPSTTIGSWPATSDLTITCTPATYDDGSASSQRPVSPSRRAEASTLASTARRGITTPFGVPVDPDVWISSGSGLVGLEPPRQLPDGDRGLVRGAQEGHAPNASRSAVPRAERPSGTPRASA